MARRWHTITESGNTTQRGYGNAHQKARRAAAAVHHPSDPCARCGHPLGVMGPWLHYDHNDDRSGYLGFSHGSQPCPTCRRKCNLRAGAQEGRARQADAAPRRRWAL